jgi:hypothetical protein
MANTYTLIASSTVGAGGAASIDFSSIPSTFTDLVVKFCARATSNPLSAAWCDTSLTFNGSTTGFTERILFGNGSAAASGSGSGISIRTPSTGATSTTFGNSEIYIPNYAGSANKSVSIDNITENNATQAFTGMAAGLWSNTAAINRVTITATSTNFAEFSTAYLYGVKNA